MTTAREFLEKNKKSLNLSDEGLKNNYFKTIMKLIDSGVNKDEVLDVFKEYENKKNLYRLNKVYFNDYFNSGFKHKNLENFRDALYKVNLNQNHSQILKRLRSKNNLINKETKSITLSLAEEGVDSNFIGDVIGKKIATIKDSESLNEILNKELKFIQGEWNMNSFKNKIKNKNVKIISEENNQLVIAVNDFQASSKLGTNNWCLVRNKSDYDYYAKSSDGYKQINFIYNFNKSPENNDSMIAVLSRINGSIYETYNKNDDLINNKNVINIEFPAMNRMHLKDRIESDFEGEYESDNKRKELINYGFYKEAQKDISKEDYQLILSNMFSNNVGKVTFSGDLFGFFDELEKKNTTELNGVDLSPWLRESVYLGDYVNVEKLLEKELVKNIIKKDFESLNIDLTNIYNDIFRSDNLRGFKFAKTFNEILSNIAGKENIKALPVFEVAKYSETALDFIEKEMPFIKENHLKEDSLSKNIIELLSFDYSEENIENYFKFMNITEQNIDVLEDLIEQGKIETLLKNKGNVFPKIKQPIIKIIGQDKFDKKATLTMEMINVYGLVNQNVINDVCGAPTLQDLTIFKIEKLNKENTEKFLNILIGRKEKRVDNYKNANVVCKSIFKQVIKKHKENLDKNTINNLLTDLDLTQKQKNTKKIKP